MWPSGKGPENKRTRFESIQSCFCTTSHIRSDEGGWGMRPWRPLLRIPISNWPVQGGQTQINIVAVHLIAHVTCTTHPQTVAQHRQAHSQCIGTRHHHHTTIFQSDRRYHHDTMSRQSAYAGHGQNALYTQRSCFLLVTMEWSQKLAKATVV